MRTLSFVYIRNWNICERKIEVFNISRVSFLYNYFPNIFLAQQYSTMHTEGHAGIQVKCQSKMSDINDNVHSTTFIVFNFFFFYLLFSLLPRLPSSATASRTSCPSTISSLIPDGLWTLDACFLFILNFSSLQPRLSILCVVFLFSFFLPLTLLQFVLAFFCFAFFQHNYAISAGDILQIWHHIPFSSFIYGLFLQLFLPTSKKMSSATLEVSSDHND